MGGADEVHLIGLNCCYGGTSFVTLEETWSTLLVLCVAILSKWIPGFSTISSEDVQIPIEAKQQLASVVVCGWLLDLQNDPECKKDAVQYKTHLLEVIFLFFRHKYLAAMILLYLFNTDASICSNYITESAKTEQASGVEESVHPNYRKTYFSHLPLAIRGHAESFRAGFAQVLR